MRISLTQLEAENGTVREARGFIFSCEVPNEKGSVRSLFTVYIDYPPRPGEKIVTVWEASTFSHPFTLHELISNTVFSDDVKDLLPAFDEIREINRSADMGQTIDIHHKLK